MKIEVIDIAEHPDGSARLTLDIDSKTVGLLLESAIITVLTEFISNREKEEI